MIDFVDEFTAAYDQVAPPLFVKWGAISAISGALERKVWVYTKRSNLYPNLYVFLVAPPGVGKSEITWRARDHVSKVPEHHVARASITKAALIDNLNESKRVLIRKQEQPPVVEFNALTIAVDELGVLLPNYDMEFLNTLTHLYDGRVYDEARRTKDLKIEIKHPYVNLLAGATPAFLKETLPVVAWDQGFMSRVIMVFAGGQEERSPFDEESTPLETIQSLQRNLNRIGSLYGKYKFSHDAKSFIEGWLFNGKQPQPEHPRLMNYATRRLAHLLKLSLISCASSCSEPVIEKEHCERALEWLIEAESEMPEIFKSMRSGGDSQIIEDTWHHLYTLYMREGKKPIAEFRIVQFLSERAPVHNIVRILEAMERAKMLQRKPVPGVGIGYVPLQKKDF